MRLWSYSTEKKQWMHNELWWFMSLLQLYNWGISKLNHGIIQRKERATPWWCNSGGQTKRRFLAKKKELMNLNQATCFSLDLETFWCKTNIDITYNSYLAYKHMVGKK